MADKEQKCPECGQDFATKTGYRDHMRVKHRWQAVVCPLCPSWSERKTPHGLQKHVRADHPTAASEVFTTSTMYFFSLNPLRYREISIVRKDDAIAATALLMLGRWAEFVGSSRSLALMKRVQEDWAKHLRLQGKEGATIATPQVARPASCTEAAEKRTAETSTSAAPPEKRLKDDGSSVRVLDVTLRGKSAGEARAVSMLPGYTGIIRIEFQLDATPLRCVLRVMEALQEEDTFELEELETERELDSDCDIKESVAEALRICPGEVKRLHLSATTGADQQWQPPVGEGNLLELSARLAGIVPEEQLSLSNSRASGSQHQSVPVMEDVADIPLPPDTEGDVAEVPDVPFPPPPAGILTPRTSAELVQLLSLPPPPPPLLVVDVPSPVTPIRTQQPEPGNSVPATTQQPLPVEPESGDSPLPAVQQPSPGADDPSGDSPTGTPAVAPQQAPSTPRGSQHQSHSLSAATARKYRPTESRGLSSDPTQPLQPRASSVCRTTVPLPLGIQMTRPPPLKSVPKAKVRFTHTHHQPQPGTSSSLAMPQADIELLKNGCWPLLSPGRRDWSEASMQIALPVNSITWPPRNWRQMDKEQLAFATQVVAAMVATGDEEPGNFPLTSPSNLLEDYNMLALPGTGTRNGQDHMALARRQLHSALRHTLTPRHREVHAGMVNLLRAGATAGPPARNELLRQVNLQNVPLLPYTKGQVQEPGPEYSPSRPGLED